MNALKNKVQLIGRAGMEPEVKEFGNDKVMARFSLATNESYKDKNGEWVDNTMWHTIVAWNGTAKRVEKIVEKGSEIVLEGRLVNRQFEDKEGNKRYLTEVVAHELMVMNKK